MVNSQGCIGSNLFLEWRVEQSCSLVMLIAQNLLTISLGVKGIIAKPFDPLTLHRAIASALNWELGT